MFLIDLTIVSRHFCMTSGLIEALQLAESIGRKRDPIGTRAAVSSKIAQPSTRRVGTPRSRLISFPAEILAMISGCLRLVYLFPLPKLLVEQLL